MKMTDKEIRDEAMRRVMWQVGNTNNDVTRYISDAVAKQIIRDEHGEKESVSQMLEAIREDICDNYCKFRDTADEEYLCDVIRNGGECPLDRLN